MSTRRLFRKIRTFWSMHGGNGLPFLFSQNPLPRPDIASFTLAERTFFDLVEDSHDAHVQHLRYSALLVPPHYKSGEAGLLKKVRS